MSIGFAGALVGGVLTLLSPCSVMLLPAFFAYAFASPTKLFARCGLFYLGLLTTLVPMGILAGSVGSFITTNRSLLFLVAGICIAILGVGQIIGVRLPSLASNGTEGTGSLAVYLLGTVYGIAGACTGPLLGSVLMLAATGGSSLYGGVLLAIFALGMTVPLLVLSFLWSRTTKLQQWLRPRKLRIGDWENTWNQVLSGIFCIGIGVFLALNGNGFDGGVLTASQQMQVETSAARFTSTIPNWIVVVVALAILGVVVAVHRSRRRKQNTVDA